MAQYSLRLEVAEMGIIIRKPGWNIGNCASSLRLVLGNALSTRVSHKVSARVHAGDLQIRQSNEGAGSMRGGTMRGAPLQYGLCVDLNSMSILRAQLHDSPEGQ